MSSLITFLWYYPASYQHPVTLIQLTFLHFDLKSVSCLENFDTVRLSGKMKLASLCYLFLTIEADF